MLWSYSLELYYKGTFPTPFCSDNFQSNCSSKLLLVAGSERIDGRGSLSSTRKASQYQETIYLQTRFWENIEKVQEKYQCRESCFTNLTLWFYQNMTSQSMFSEEWSNFGGVFICLLSLIIIDLIGLYRSNCLNVVREIL